MVDWRPTSVATSMPYLLSPLIELAKRREHGNQAELFKTHQLYVQRVLSVLASSASIAFCVVGIYMLLAIDPRRLIFRHHLIFFLLLFDLLKAIVLLLYPARVLSHARSYNDTTFCQVVGFFTAVAIEGADIAILAFAVHTYCLIFKPNLQTRVKNSTRTEGGLYRYRYLVYLLSFLFPLVIASLAFVSGRGYKSFVCWCYLPQRPVWYRFVLSWVPRYLILITIIIIYCMVYFHVIREFKALGGMFTTYHRSHAIHPHLSQDEKPTFFSALKFFFAAMRDHIAPKFIMPDNEELKKQEERKKKLRSKNQKFQRTTQQKEDAELEDDEATENGDLEDDSNPKPEPDHTNDILHDPEIHQQNLENFRKRQKIIEKQMKSIFIYPFAYCFIWLFPFLLQSTQVNYEESHGPIYWLNCMGAFMQPIPGFVDTTVFFYREQPWKYTSMAIFKKEHTAKMNSMASQPGRETDDESLSTSARLTKNSLSTGLIEIQNYRRWRRILSYLRFPFFRLPNDGTVSKLQTQYIHDRLLQEKNQSFNANTSAGTSNAHDFSVLLSGDLIEAEFRSQMENLSLSFDNRSQQRSNRKDSIMSSVRSRHLHPDDPHYVDPHQRNSFSRNQRRDLIPNTTTSSNTRRSNNTSARQSISAGSTDNDMDFLQFLKSGPP